MNERLFLYVYREHAVKKYKIRWFNFSS